MNSQVLEYKDYQGSIETSIEDGVLFGKILHINDLVTYEAESIPQLKTAFEESVDDYLEMCAEEGVAPDKPYRGSFNVRVGPTVHRKLALAAAREGMTINETIKKITETWLRDCPDGFSVFHHHQHDYRVIHADESSKLYRGAVDLDTNWRTETIIPTSVTMQ